MQKIKNLKEQKTKQQIKQLDGQAVLNINSEQPHDQQQQNEQYYASSIQLINKLQEQHSTPNNCLRISILGVGYFILFLCLMAIILNTISKNKDDNIKKDIIIKDLNNSDGRFTTNFSNTIENNNGDKESPMDKNKQRAKSDNNEIVVPNSNPVLQINKQLNSYGQYRSRIKGFKHQQLMRQPVLTKINQLLKNSFYDVHYFIQANQTCPHQSPIVLHQYTPIQQSIQRFRPRMQLNLTKNESQLAKITQSMKNNKYRTNRNIDLKLYKKTPQSIEIAQFFSALNHEPEDSNYLQAQFSRYHKKYDIGRFGQQIPLCVTFIGKNSYKYIDRVYASIERQNYTNYVIVHVDDNSDDGTQDKILELIKNKPQFGNKITLITQQVRRNQLYNRHQAIKHCQDNSVVLQMDADDWLIGKQVFQLINTIYQGGKKYKNKTYDVWSAYFSHINYKDPCSCILPGVQGQIAEGVFKSYSYRAFGRWRTSHLRTFLKAVYLKINITQYLDIQGPQGYFYPQGPDTFINTAIVQLSGYKHTMFIDEFLHYYSASYQSLFQRALKPEIFYSVRKAQSLAPYQELQNLESPVKKAKNYRVNHQTLNQLKKRILQVRQIRYSLFQKIKKIVEES